MPSEVKLPCSVCKLAISARNFRRHMQKEHKISVATEQVKAAVSSHRHGRNAP